MIDNQRELAHTLETLRKYREQRAWHQRELSEQGLGPEEIDRALEPTDRFFEGWEAEVEEYEARARTDAASQPNGPAWTT